MNKQIERKVTVSNSIMQSVGITYEQLKSILIDLHTILGEKAIKLIPEQVNDFGTLAFIVKLCESLKKLRYCEGFNEHIARYTNKQIHSSYFVIELASFLFDKVDTLSLEPMTAKSKMADILVNARGQNIFLECKCIESTNYDHSKEHNHIFSLLKPYFVNIPHEISITYRQALSEDNIRRLGEAIRERAKSVSSNGKIIDNADVLVNIIKREIPNNKRVKLYMSMIQENLDERCRYPGHVFGIDGITLSISGPKVNYGKIFKEKIRRSRNQSPEKDPYILMIDGNLMLGSLTDNIRALSSAFQPTVNTRFSSAVIVEHNPRIGTAETDFNFHVVNNPFAKFPVNEEFTRLFKET
jgi:hypothetical protein